MTDIVHLRAPDGVAPGIGYTQVIAATGRLVVVSGQVAIDAEGRLVGPGDPGAQARQVFANLSRCLAAADAGWRNVVQLTYFLTDIAYLDAIHEARDEFVDTSAPPCGLPRPGCRARPTRVSPRGRGACRGACLTDSGPRSAREQGVERLRAVQPVRPRKPEHGDNRAH